MTPTLFAGDLRDRVTIERDDTVPSASGGTKAWTTPYEVAEVWAKIQPMHAGREVFGNPEWTASVGIYKIHIRWRDDLDEKMRVKYVQPSSGNVRYFSIRSIPMAGRSQQFLSLLCEEVK